MSKIVTFVTDMSLNEIMITLAGYDITELEVKELEESRLG